MSAPGESLVLAYAWVFDGFFNDYLDDFPECNSTLMDVCCAQLWLGNRCFDAAGAAIGCALRQVR
jgi:hypothetical protein